MKHPSFAGLALAAGVLGTSCYVGEESPRPQMMPAAYPAAHTRDQAAAILAEARCDHEAQCGGIGPTSRYTTRQQCVDLLGRDSWQNLANCSYGIKDRELRSCVVEIRGQTCGSIVNPLDWLNRTVTCQSNTICLH